MRRLIAHRHIPLSLGRGPRRRIVDETQIWTPEGYALFEVLECGHTHIGIFNSQGFPNCQSRRCKPCILDLRPTTWNVPSWEEMDKRSANWYEEKIAIYDAPTQFPYIGYKFGSGPKGELLSQMRILYELLHLW